MAIVTMKSLQDQIAMLKAMNECYSKEINKLNSQINEMKEEYKEGNDKLLNEIYNLKQQLESSEIKLNNRNAGRKAYSNKLVIEKIYDLYLSGRSLQGIADELKYSEIKTSRGKDWSKSSIRFILINHENVVNEIVEEEDFNRAVKLLNDKRK
ncbi:MAG: recombinase family protein [Clostridiaceae bacterium]